MFVEHALYSSHAYLHASQIDDRALVLYDKGAPDISVVVTTHHAASHASFVSSSFLADCLLKYVCSCVHIGVAGAQAVPAVRQNDPRPRGRGRGRGRGGGRGADRQYEQMQPSGDTMVPPGNFGAPSGQAPAMPPKIVIIKKRPQPATAAPE